MVFNNVLPIILAISFFFSSSFHAVADVVGSTIGAATLYAYHHFALKKLESYPTLTHAGITTFKVGMIRTFISLFNNQTWLEQGIPGALLVQLLKEGYEALEAYFATPQTTTAQIPLSIQGVLYFVFGALTIAGSTRISAETHHLIPHRMSTDLLNLSSIFLATFLCFVAKIYAHEHLINYPCNNKKRKFVQKMYGVGVKFFCLPLCPELGLVIDTL